MKLLFVEDNAKLGAAAVRALERLGFSVDLFRTVEDGWHAWRCSAYDALILDIMLEEENGLELLARGRSAGLSTPALVLTALGSIPERIEGLNAGADDYMVKPFAVEELAARLRALGRRPASLLDAVLRFGDVAFDPGVRELEVGGRRASLSRAEGMVLERFLRAQGRIVTKEQLGESLHALAAEFTENSIQIHVHRVRRKLGELSSAVSIRALRGIGYLLTSGGEA